MMVTGKKTQRSRSKNKMESITVLPFDTRTDFADVNSHFADRPLDELLQWSLSTFGDKVVQVTSFGPTGMVILDHLARLSPGIRVITIDTNFLFEETYALMEQIERRYSITLDICQPTLTPQAQARIYRSTLWRKNPDLCCYLRKVVPLYRALSGVDAWITGLRRDQSPTRTNLSLVSWDVKYHNVKINPLAYWTRHQLWTYIRQHNIPYNVLHDRGYASIGCVHCTRPISELLSANERAGRWQGWHKIECGIHR